MNKKSVEKKDVFKSDINKIITKVNGIYKNINNLPLTEKQEVDLYNDCKFFKNTLLYSILFSTEIQDLEKIIIKEVKTLEELNYYRAVLADRYLMLENIDNIIAKRESKNISMSSHKFDVEK